MRWRHSCRRCIRVQSVNKTSLRDQMSVSHIGLKGVREFRIPGSILDSTLETLVEAGRRREEAFVLWGGVLFGGGQGLRFTTAIRPAQVATSTPRGLLVSVDGAALFSVNKAMFEAKAILAGQVHTHPTEAFHSETDDHYPLVTLLGALSLVIPDFARDGRHGMDRWAWYRLSGYGKWSALSAETKVTIEK